MSDGIGFVEETGFRQDGEEAPFHVSALVNGQRLLGTLGESARGQDGFRRLLGAWR